MSLEYANGEFCIDAAMLSELLDMSPTDMQASMRRHEITSLCERGEGEDEGRYRLTFFHRTRRVRLQVDRSGRILGNSIIRYGDRRPPRLAPTAGSLAQMIASDVLE